MTSVAAILLLAFVTVLPLLIQVIAERKEA